MHWALLSTRKPPLRCSWQGDAIAVMDGHEVIERLLADEVDRVTLVHADAGDSPGEVRAALFEMADRAVLLDAASGIAGRVLFERQAFWAQRNCIYWASERFLSWPPGLGESRWLFARQLPAHQQLTSATVAALLARAVITGPHTWDQRKQVRVDRQRPFPARAVDPMPLRTAAH